MNITLTESDIRELAETARAALARSIGQVALLRKGFPHITDADINGMVERIDNDPQTGTRQEQIDVAAYYLALHVRAYEKTRAALDELTSNGTPTTLHNLFLLLTGCADIVNGLTFLQAGGGLATKEHVAEAESVARRTVAKNSANVRHAPTNAAKLWVQQEWGNYKVNHDNNKAAFAKLYVDEVLNKYHVSVTAKTIAESWLSPSASKQ
jgi:hypothetical protein